MSSLLVSKLRISDRVAEKLLSKHGLTADEVRDAVEDVRNLDFKWNTHPTRGPRAFVRTKIRERTHLIVLYPAIGESPDVWNLGTAYEIDPRK